MSDEGIELSTGDAIMGAFMDVFRGKSALIRKLLAKLVEDTKREAARRAWEACSCAPCGRKRPMRECEVVRAILDDGGERPTRG